MAVGFDDFVGQVVAFLEPEHQRDYHQRAAWDALQENVVAVLEALQP